MTLVAPGLLCSAGMTAPPPPSGMLVTVTGSLVPVYGALVAIIGASTDSGSSAVICHGFAESTQRGSSISTQYCPRLRSGFARRPANFRVSLFNRVGENG